MTGKKGKEDAARSLGQRGEHLAARHLESRGYHIVAVNWRCPQGELDIIARQGEVLVFVEVRARRAPLTETAFESINARKRTRIGRAAHAYLALHCLEDTPWRIDVIAVALPPSGHPVIEHVEDALNW